MLQISKKMRIQLFDKDFNQITDRLIDQDIELKNGPKEPHKGPMKLEFSFFDKKDIENCISYLNKISGVLPIEVKVSKAKKKEKIIADKSDLLKAWLEDESKLKVRNIKSVLNNLRREGFIMMSYDILTLLQIPILLNDEIERENYFLLYQQRKAKNPLNDKYDPTLIFSLNFLDKKSDSIVVSVYLYGKFTEVLTYDNDTKKLKVLPTAALRFPPFMIEEERIKFSKEHRELSDNSEKKPSKFYERWAPYVKLNGQPLK